MMQGSVRKWGNSAAVRIPSAILEAAHLRVDQQVDVREEGGRIVIEPVQPAGYDLDAMVAGITDANRHEPMGDDTPVGQENW